MITRALALLLALTLPAASLGADAVRGRLLYDNFCGHCHLTEIHHRARSEVHVMADLQRLVDVWQKEMGLGWGPAEIRDVSAWLDWAYYRLSPEG
jgi:hypothetical protein